MFSLRSLFARIPAQKATATPSLQLQALQPAQLAQVAGGLPRVGRGLPMSSAVVDPTAPLPRVG